MDVMMMVPSKPAKYVIKMFLLVDPIRNTIRNVSGQVVHHISLSNGASNRTETNSAWNYKG